MRAILIAGSMILLLSVPANAGPWPREEGKVFLSFSYETTTDLNGIALLDFDHAASAYGEYGLTPRLTFGIDLFRNLSASEQTSILFLRRALARSDATHQFAISLGLGTTDAGAASQSLAMLGFSWGRGISTGWGAGWTTVDAQARLTSSGDTQGKIDATLGISPTEDWKFIGQLQLDAASGTDTTARLQTTAVRRLSSNLNLEFGLLYGLHNDSTAGLKSGLWLDF
jgi:hypothetical protein